MTRVPKVTTLTQPIWPDKTLYATIFADQPPTPNHAVPQAADPDWTSLINDYISKTDNAGQTIRPPTTGFDGSLGRILQLLDPDGVHGFEILSDIGQNVAPGFYLNRKSTDVGLQAMFLINETNLSLLQNVLASDLQNFLLFGAGWLIIGDDGTVGGEATPGLGFPAFTNGIDLTRNLMANLLTLSLIHI